MKQIGIVLSITTMLIGLAMFVSSISFPIQQCRTVATTLGQSLQCSPIPSPTPMYLGITLLVLGFAFLIIAMVSVPIAQKTRELSPEIDRPSRIEPPPSRTTYAGSK